MVVYIMGLVAFVAALFIIYHGLVLPAYQMIRKALSWKIECHRTSQEEARARHSWLLRALR